MSLFQYTRDGHIMEPWLDDPTEHPPGKRPKRNPLGQDCYLGSDGAVTRDEDKIIRAQRIWKEIAYAPGGVMYRYGFERFHQIRKRLFE